METDSYLVISCKKFCERRADKNKEENLWISLRNSKLFLHE